MFCLGVTVADEAVLAEQVDSTDSTNRLLVVVTDDDFVEVSPSIWCEESIQKAVDACRDKQRTTSLKIERIRAGSPSLLRGGRSIGSGPRRVICFICDGKRRILSCCVGVPSPRQLLSFSEDGDELAVSAVLATATELKTDDEEDAGEAMSLTKSVRERATKRVTRHYRPLVEKIDPSKSIEENAALLAEALANDIKERFLFDSPVESERWVSTQQHAEARRFWCETMLISFVGKDVDEIWPELATSVWGALPWRSTESMQQFATDCSETLQQHGLVLELDLTKEFLHAESFTGPVTPTDDAPGAKRETSLVQALEAAGVKTCDLSELAVLMRTMNQSPITLRNLKTKTTRWVVFKKADEKATLLPQDAEKRLEEMIRLLVK